MDFGLGGGSKGRREGGREGGEERTGVGIGVLITLPGDVVLVGDIGAQELMEGRKGGREGRNEEL
jgi:hypothetical protein